MPVPQIGDPVPYGEAPGYDKQSRLYNHARLGDLLRGASPTASQGQYNDTAHQAGRYAFLPDHLNVDDRFMQATWSNPASHVNPPYQYLRAGDNIGEYAIPQVGDKTEIVVSVDPRTGMPESYHERPYSQSPVFSGQSEEFLNAIPGHTAIPGVKGNDYQPQVDFYAPQSPTPQAPPWNAPPNPNPFYRRPQPSIGQMMIEPPQQAGPQPDTSHNYVPYGGRF